METSVGSVIGWSLLAVAVLLVLGLLYPHLGRLLAVGASQIMQLRGSVRASIFAGIGTLVTARSGALKALVNFQPRASSYLSGQYSTTAPREAWAGWHMISALVSLGLFCLLTLSDLVFTVAKVGGLLGVPELPFDFSSLVLPISASIMMVILTVSLSLAEMVNLAPLNQYARLAPNYRTYFRRGMYVTLGLTFLMGGLLVVVSVEAANNINDQLLSYAVQVLYFIVVAAAALLAGLGVLPGLVAIGVILITVLVVAAWIVTSVPRTVLSVVGGLFEILRFVVALLTALGLLLLFRKDHITWDRLFPRRDFPTDVPTLQLRTESLDLEKDLGITKPVRVVRRVERSGTDRLGSE